MLIVNINGIYLVI